MNIFNKKFKPIIARADLQSVSNGNSFSDSRHVQSAGLALPKFCLYLQARGLKIL